MDGFLKGKSAAGSQALEATFSASVNRATSLVSVAISAGLYTLDHLDHKCAQRSEENSDFMLLSPYLTIPYL